MSTFLELCSRTRQEAAIAGTGPAAVTGQTGEMKRIVDWVTTAYQDIQNLHRNWEFLQTEFDFPTVIGQQSYTIVQAGLPELKDWMKCDYRAYTTSVGVSDEQRLIYWDWRAFRRTFLIGNARLQTGRPLYFTIKPDKSIAFFPIPDAVYTIDGEYFKRPQVMTVNTDEPLFPEEFHLILVWMALMNYGSYENAPEAYARGQENFNQLLKKLETDQLPEICRGRALA